MARAKKNDETDYEVEAVCKARVNYKKGTHIRWQYLVKWKGYDDKDNTWEPEECFEESPGLLRAFWRHADIGERKKGEERKHTRASDFKVHEEISPRDGPVSASAVTDADEEVIEKPKVVRKKQGEPRTIRRKRSLSENDENAPKRRRGRSAKDAQVITDGDAEADANGDSASQIDDELNVPDQTPQQVPENLYSNKKRDLHSKPDVGPSRRRPQANEPRKKSHHSEVRDLQSKEVGTRKGTKRRIESDDDAEGETDRESQAGSLFSETEDNTKGKKQVNNNSVPLIKKPAVDEKRIEEKRHKITVYDESRLELMRHKLLTKRRAQKPRVSITHDPEVERAINQRVNRFLNPLADTQVQQDAALEKEKATSVSPREPNLNSNGDNPSPGMTPARVAEENKTGSTLPDNTDSTANVATSASVSTTMTEQVTPLHPIVEPSVSHTVRSTKTPSALILPVLDNGIDDLEDFVSNEKDDAKHIFRAGTETGTSVQIVEEVKAWTLSTIFAPAAPPPGSELPSEVIVATKPTKNLIHLRLSPDLAIPIKFKDVHPATWDAKETLVVLLSGEHDGLPGKLYPRDVLEHLALGGSSARLVADDTATQQQIELLRSLTRQLEENGHIVIVALNCLTFLVLPSQNRSVASRIGIPDSLVGLDKSLLIQNVKISNDIEFLNFALDAKDIALTTGNHSHLDSV